MKKKMSWKIISAIGMLVTTIAGIITTIGEQKQIEEAVEEAMRERENTDD